MQRVAPTLSHGLDNIAFRLANKSAVSQQRQQRFRIPIMFAYEFTTCEALFESLAFIRNVEHRPIDPALTQEDFETIYGISRFLEFTVQAPKAAREHPPMNWWLGLY